MADVKTTFPEKDGGRTTREGEYGQGTDQGNPGQRSTEHDTTTNPSDCK